MENGWREKGEDRKGREEMVMRVEMGGVQKDEESMNQEAQSKEVENDEKEPVANETEEWREIKE